MIDALLQKKLISWQHVFDVTCLWVFGRLINNTDMHLGNLSLAIDGSVFSLLPIYDMCIMGFSPRSDEVIPFSFVPSKTDDLKLKEDALQGVKEMVFDFWERVAADERISDEFKSFLERGNPVDLS